MTATIIKSLNNIGQTIDIESDKPARQIFKYVNFENAVLIVNGHIENPEYIIKNTDIVTLRLLPADPGDKDNWWVWTFFIPFGIIIQPAVMAIKAREQAEKADKELEKIKKLTNEPGLDNRPFLRGASNTIATGKSQPYFCGRNFLTPYLFSKQFYKIYGAVGTEQEVFTILEGGFRGIVLDKLGIGETTIKQWNDDAPQNGVYTIDSGIFAEGVVEIRQNGALFTTLTELNHKVVSNVVNKEIARDITVSKGDAEHLIIELDPNAKSVELAIKFPYGLYAYDKNNNKILTMLEVIPEYSLDGGLTFIPFTFDGGLNLFIYNTTKEMRFVAHHNFSLSDYETLYDNDQRAIIVRVRSTGNDDSKIKNDCYLYYYQTSIFDPNKSSAPAGVIDDDGESGLVSCLNVEDRERAYSCVIGIKLKATKNNEQKLTQYNLIATSTARTWNGTEWTTEKSPTRNPAAIALEVMTTDIHPASQYNDNEIDLTAWGALYDYCEDNNIYFDYVISQNQRKNDVLQKICDVCNATIYKDIYGRISVAIDKANNNIIAVYNPQNIVKITNKKSFSRRVDALRIKYVDSANDTFKENVYTVTRIENGEPITIDENSIIKEVSATGITTHEQIVKYGRRLMAVDELRQITTQIKVGLEGVYYTPCSRVLIQDPSLNSDAQDAIIESVVYNNGLLKKIILKNPVTFDALKAYGVIINCVDENGAHPLPLKVEGPGTTKELNVITNYSIAESIQPGKYNALSFGELDAGGEFSKITHDYIIVKISRTDDGYNLDLQEYNEAIYESGVIPPYKPIINATPTLTPEEIPIDAVTSDKLEERLDGFTGDSAQAAIDTVTRGFTFTNIYKIKPQNLTLEDVIKKMDDDARNASASISMSADEILLQVQSLDEQQRAFIAITKDQILAQVDDMAQELTGLIDIQAGAVQAIVEGGGSSGQMSLSLNLPVIIDSQTRDKLIAVSHSAKVNAVYGLIENTSNYGIKGNAGSAAIKALWDDAVSAGLLASQIDLSATQIKINGDNIYINGDTIFTGAVGAEKLKAELLDVEAIFAKKITIKDKGSISGSFNGSFDNNGVINSDGTTGWAIDNQGNSVFNNLHAKNASIIGEITSQDFDAQTPMRGYRLFTSGGVGKAEIPIINCWQLSPPLNYKRYEPIYIANGVYGNRIELNVNSMVGDLSRTSWPAIFQRLDLLNGHRGGTAGYAMCNGYINGIKVQYIQIYNSLDVHYVEAMGYDENAKDKYGDPDPGFHYMKIDFIYGQFPTVPVDLIV